MYVPELRVLCLDDARARSGAAAGARQRVPHDQVLRNHSVGRTCSGAASGPRFVAVMRTTRSVGLALAYSTCDVEVAVLGEDAGIDQLVLRLVLAAPAVLRDELARTERRAADTCTARACTSGSASSRGRSSTP